MVKTLDICNHNVSEYKQNMDTEDLVTVVSVIHKTGFVNINTIF